MRNAWNLCVVVLAAVLVAACGNSGSGGSSTDASGSRGSLIQNPPLRIASLTATDFAAQLNATAAGQQLVAVAGAPVCGVDFHYIQYGTVGGAGETTTASGALMIPTGTATGCSGARPIVLYAHGTATDRTFNIADITNPANSEGALIAAMFAAQGYIVVAPNYAGYDSSPLPYHPFLNADQQSKDMIDALTAARKAIGHVFAAGTTDNGKLFLTGYSQGGYVAMATQRAMQAASMTFTASAPMSGPYALSAFGDAVFYGDVNLGSTEFTPLITTSYQKAYGNLYTATTDVFTSTYATGIDTLLPSTTPIGTLIQQGKLPQLAMFSSTPPTGTFSDAFFASITPPTTPAAQAPLFALGFGASNLVTNTYRVAYLTDAIANPDGAVPSATTGLPPSNPQNKLRVAFKTNDLRNFLPSKPTLLCGGHSDPTVFYSVNTQVMQAFWAPQVSPQLLTVVDVDPGTSAPADAVQAGFLQAEAATSAAAGGGAAGQNAVVAAYHGTLVPPFCTAAVRSFFSQF